MAKALVLLLSLWLFADFATPFIPGAFVFDDSKSVNVTLKRAEVPASIVAMPRPSESVGSASRDTAADHRAPRQYLLGEWLPEVRITFLPCRIAKLPDPDPSS